jgi:hypothetical protein
MGPPANPPADRYPVALRHPPTAALLKRYATRRLLLLLIGLVPVLLADALKVPRAVLVFAVLFAVVPGCGGLVRAAKRWITLRHHPWVKTHQRGANLNWNLLGRRLKPEFVLLAAETGDRPYRLNEWTWFGPPPLEHGIAIWVAGRPGRDLVFADRGFTKLGQLRPARTTWTRSRWLVAFTEPDLAARESIVRTGIVWARRIRRLRSAIGRRWRGAHGVTGTPPEPAARRPRRARGRGRQRPSRNRRSHR